jgi:peroxiredoxin
VKLPFKLIVPLAALAIGASAALTWLPQPAAPEVRFATLAGESFTTSQLRGKVVLVNFWATNCASCIAEMPKLTEAYKKYEARGYDMVAVALSHDHPNRVADFAQKNGLPFKVALDTTGEIGKQFGNIRVTPTTILLDRQGRVIKHYVGEPDWKEFDSVVSKALAEPA